MISSQLGIIALILFGITSTLATIRLVLGAKSLKKLPKGYLTSLDVIKNPGKDRSIRTLNLITIYTIISMICLCIVVTCGGLLYKAGL